jgi:hypothetical protein
MVRLYIIFLLTLFFTYSIAKNIDKYYPNRTNVPSRSIYDLVQLRLAADRLAKQHRNNTRLSHKFSTNRTYASRMKMSYSKDHHNQILFERLKIMITISGIVLAFMITIVIICILIRCRQDKNPKPTERVEQKLRTTQYYRVKSDKRNFARKERPLPEAV